MEFGVGMLIIKQLHEAADERIKKANEMKISALEDYEAALRRAAKIIKEAEELKRKADYLYILNLLFSGLWYR
jgi:hypothetical protein